MDSAAKHAVIREWIDPEERITVDLVDEEDVSAVLTGCTNEPVDRSLDTRFLHLRQQLCVSMSQVMVGEDPTHYTRDSEKPLRHARLRLMMLQHHPEWT